MEIRWPNGKRFAFSIFDDPDNQSLAESREIYGFLSELGFRTTIGVWPLAAPAEANSPGETCANPEYVSWIQELQRRGFEVGLHSVAPATLERAQIRAGLDRFRDLFGPAPITMANHYNGDAMYWGPARLTGIYRAAYLAATLGRTSNRHFGQVVGHPSFWGDLCRERVRYCRNFVFRDVNTLSACPWMPYHDPARPLVDLWYASTEGSNCERFVENVTQRTLEQLEAEGGACIMYTHLGHGFGDGGTLDPRFRRVMEWLSIRNGWFVPVGTMLDFLGARSADRDIRPRQRASLERRWLTLKLRRGTS